MQIQRYASLSYCYDSSMPESGRMIRSSLAAHQRRIKGTIKVIRSSSPHFTLFYTQCLLMIMVASTVDQESKADRSLSFQKCFEFNLPRSNISLRSLSPTTKPEISIQSTLKLSFLGCHCQAPVTFWSSTPQLAYCPLSFTGGLRVARIPYQHLKSEHSQHQ